MANFNLGERDMTIHVRNMSNENPENTPLTANGNIYRGDYFIGDITKLEDGMAKVGFQNLHCNYDMVLTINPNNYVKDLFIRYTYDKYFTCKYEIEPKSFENFVKVSIQSESPTTNISLNDLYIWHYAIVFVFGLFFVIYIMIKWMDKKGILIAKKQ